MSAFWNRADKLPEPQRTIINAWYARDGYYDREAVITDLTLAGMDRGDAERWAEDTNNEAALNDWNYVGSRHHY